jgi:hypothetical protein
METYLDTTIDVYKQTALRPGVGLCYTTTPIWQLPDLTSPKIMQEKNYGCGSMDPPKDLINSPSYFGDKNYFYDQKGHVRLKNQSLAICDKTAAAISTLERNDIYVSNSTYFYDGEGCC